jgi:hypothetical protein
MARGEYWLPISGLSGLTAVPFAQLATPATTGIEILGIELGQETSETSQQEQLQLNRRTTASTLPTSTTPNKTDPNDQASKLTGSTTTNATGIASASGTTGDILLLPSFNVLNSFVWSPMARLFVPPSSFIVLEFKTAPAANTWSGAIYFRETS